MRLLLDTHTLLWWLANTPLKDEARAAIADRRPFGRRVGERRFGLGDRDQAGSGKAARSV